MKIGLIDIEPKIINTAHMQISRYHKERGDEVKWWLPLENHLFDVIYCSSIFNFTIKADIPERAICGGTGFNIKSRLPKEIEDDGLDYDIYPKCDRSIIWFSRGCKRKCPWCIVHDKEGGIRTVKPKNLNPAGRYIVVQDNDFFGNPEWEKAFFQLRDWGKPVDMQGIDVRGLTIYRIEKLMELKHHKRIKIAWDDPKNDLRKKLKFVTKYIKPDRLMCYVLIGFNSSEKEDLFRIETLRSLGINPFVMPFNKTNLYQKAMARWVNHKAIFKKVKWIDYKNRVTQSEFDGRGWGPKGKQKQ